MNFGNLLNLIAENNIDPGEIFVLVEKIKNLDLNDEANIRNVIREVSKIANKPIDPIKEDALVKKIMSDGVSEDLLNYL